MGIASNRVEEIFSAAVDTPDRAARAAYLDGACGGDVALRRRVDALLASHDACDSFLASAGPDGTVGAAIAAASALTERPGTTVGRYKLLQLIGEGGFGSVFMAQQDQPVRRTVALKVIKLGMDTKQVIARFEAERQALAMMDHPNIARVLDAGATDAGRPYFVMELVRGVPITEYCDTNNLSTRERLELFIPVCHAVQHAHQKGVIHRDIKPSNIMVTMADGVPIPKVIDFGIAKATNARLTELTLFTEYRHLVGTPEYMSPEQAEMTGIDIDTRSDVYSLGVLLYELLTGTTPFDARDLRSKAYGEIQRIIREVEPPRPSTRISSLGATLATTAARRRTEPRKLGQLMRGELDWVVMKALEKDRTRRYETASGLAADVKRYLDNDPVAARPSSAAYRLTKLARRHKAGAVGAALVLLALLLGMAGTTGGMVRARWAQGRAEAEGSRARQAESLGAAAHALAEQRRVAAERAAREAGAVKDFMRGMLAYARPDPARAGRPVSVADMLDLASARLGEVLAGQPGAELEVRTTLGETYRSLALYPQAERNFSRAYLLAPSVESIDPRRRAALAVDLADAVLRNVGSASAFDAEPALRNAGSASGDDAEAVARSAYEQARQALGDGDPLTRKAADVLARSLLYSEFTPRALEAEALLAPLADQVRRHGPAWSDPDASQYLSDLADVLERIGRAGDASVDALRREADQIRPPGDQSNPLLRAQAQLARGRLLELNSPPSLAQAQEAYDDALRLRRRWLGDGHPQTREALGRTAALLARTGQLEKALACRQELLEHTLSESGSDVEAVSAAQVAVADLLTRLQRAGEASDLMQEAARLRLRVASVEQPPNASRLNTLPIIAAHLGQARDWQAPALYGLLWQSTMVVADEAPARIPDSDADWGAARFTLWPWRAAEGGAAAPVAEGPLADLKKLEVPQRAGLYFLVLNVPPSQGVGGGRPGAPLAFSSWLLVSEWSVDLYDLPAPTAGADGPVRDWRAELGPGPRAIVGPVAEHRTLPLLLIADAGYRPWGAVLGGVGAGPGGQSTNFGLVAETTVDLPAGTYRFAATSDDGVRVWVDGTLYIDSWISKAPHSNTATAQLGPGRHQVRVEFYQGDGAMHLSLTAEPLGPAAEAMAASALAPNEPALRDWHLSHARASLDEARGARTPADARAAYARAQAGFQAALDLDAGPVTAASAQPASGEPAAVREALAEALSGRGDHAGAAEVLRGTLSNRGPAMLSERGEALRLTELLAAELLAAGGPAPVAEAVGLRRQVLSAYAALDPLDHLALAAAARLALALEQSGDVRAARAACEVMLERARAAAAGGAPDAATTAYRVGAYLAWAGDMARAEGAFRLAHAGLTSAGDDARAALALVGLCHALLAQGNVAEAEVAGRQALAPVAGNAADPRADPAALALAEVLAARGRSGEASTLLRDAVGRARQRCVWGATEDDFVFNAFVLDRASAVGAAQEADALRHDLVVLALSGGLDAGAAHRVWRAAGPAVAATRGQEPAAAAAPGGGGSGPAEFDARTRRGLLRARWMLSRAGAGGQPRRQAASTAFFAWGPQEVERLDRILLARPDDPDVLAGQARVLARLGRYREALAGFERAVHLQPCRHSAWQQLLSIRLYLGDAEGYRRDSATAVRIFGDSSSRDVCDRIAKAVAVGEQPPELDRLTAMVDRAVAPGENPNREWFHLCKALVEYRRGNHQAALDWAEYNAGDADAQRVAYRDVLRAMAQHRLGQTENARAQLAQASRWIDARCAVPGRDDTGGDVHDLLNPLILLREAQALIGGATTNPPGANGDGTAPAPASRDRPAGGADPAGGNAPATSRSGDRAAAAADGIRTDVDGAGGRASFD